MDNIEEIFKDFISQSQKQGKYLRLSVEDGLVGNGFIGQKNNQKYLKVKIDGLNNQSSGGVQSVTGLNTDNSDDKNPIVQISVDGSTITGNGTPSSPLTVTTGGVASVSSGINISVDNTDPLNPIINSLSDRYKTTSTTSRTIVATGSLTFTVDANLSYIPLQEVLIVNNASNYMLGTVTAYSGTTLTVSINSKLGSGTYASWTINLDGTPVDAITGTGLANELAYFTAGQVLGSLPVATYPNLAETSYVKGVTSPIQIQINNKLSAIITTPISGQYLSFDGINWVNSTFVGLTGSGTSGQVPFFNSTSNLTSNSYMIFVATTGLKLGNYGNNSAFGLTFDYNTITADNFVQCGSSYMKFIYPGSGSTIYRNIEINAVTNISASTKVSLSAQFQVIVSGAGTTYNAASNTLTMSGEKFQISKEFKMAQMNAIQAQSASYASFVAMGSTTSNLFPRWANNGGGGTFYHIPVIPTSSNGNIGSTSLDFGGTVTPTRSISIVVNGVTIVIPCV